MNLKIRHNMNTLYNIRLTMMNAKKLITMFMMLSLTLSLYAQQLPREIFGELADDPEVECTYISGRFSHNQRSWRSQSGEHGMSLERGFSSMWTYQLYSDKAVTRARSILDHYLKSNKNIELVMQTKSGVQDYRIYEKFATIDGKEMIVQMIIWSFDAPNVGEICVINWDKGLEPSKNPYSFVPGKIMGMSKCQKNLGGWRLSVPHIESRL